MNEKLNIILDAIWKGGSAAQQAQRAITGVGDATKKTALEQQIAAEKSRMFAQRQSELAQAVLKGEMSLNKAEAELKQYRNELGMADSAAQKAGASFGKKLAVGVGAATVAFGAAVVAGKKLWDTLGQGAALERSRSQFENLAKTIDATADSMLVKMRAATSGMMSDAQLIASAGQIISLGLADTEEKTIRLVNAIGVLGLDMQQVIMTFANNSVMRLDALGLSVEDVTSKAKELEEQGFVGDAFDEAVLIALEEKMGVLGSTAGTTAGNMAVMTAATQNAMDAFKVELVDSMAEALFEVAGGAKSAAPELENLAASGGRLLGSVLGGVTGILVDAGKEFQQFVALKRVADEGLISVAEYNRVLWEGFDSQAGRNALKIIEEYIQRVSQEQRRAAGSAEMLNEQMARQAAHNQRVAESQRGVIRGLEEGNWLYGQYAAAADAAGATVAAQLDSQRQQLELWREAASPIGAIIQAQSDLSAAQGEWVQTTRNNSRDIASISAKLAGDLTDEQRKAYQEIVNTASEGSAEWLAAYNALQSDLTASTRAGMVAQLAELQAAQGERISIYTGDKEAAEEAAAALAQAQAALQQEYLQTAFDALTATSGLTDQSVELAVALGMVSEEEAELRLQYAQTIQQMEAFAETSGFAALSAERQAGAIESVASGLYDTAAAAVAAQQNIQKVEDFFAGGPDGDIGTFYQSLDDAPDVEVTTALDTSQANTDYEALVSQIESSDVTTPIGADTSAALREFDELRAYIEGTRITANITAATGGSRPPTPREARAASDVGRAAGGPVMGGSMYMVGELGPELFVPQQNGYIVPNNQISNSYGGDTITVNNYNRQAAAVSMAMIAMQRRARLDRRMGLA